MTDSAEFLDFQRNGDVLRSIRRLDGAAHEGPDRLRALNAHLFAPRGEASNAFVEREYARHLELLEGAGERDRAVITYNLGCIALFQDDILTAKLRFTEAARLQPGHAAALHNLALAEELMADFDEARRHLQDALELDAGQRLSQVSLALLLSMLGERVEGLRLLRELHRADPGNVGVLYTLCRTLLAGNTVADATEVRSLLEQDGAWEDFPEIRECRGHALLLLEEWQEAEQAFRDVLSEQEARPFSRLGLVKALAEQEDYGALLAAAENYAALVPSAEIRDIIEQIKAL